VSAIRIASKTSVETLLADVPVPFIADTAVIKITLDELIATIAPVFGIHFDE
jgi:hypothetical protein